MKSEPRVLVASHQLTNGHSLQHALERGGYGVVPATSGGEAQALIWDEEQDFTAVVTDVMLAGEEAGWEIAREARKRDPNVPIIYMTPDGSHAWAYSGVPDSLLLRMPVTSGQIVSAVSSLLNREESTRHPDGE